MVVVVVVVYYLWLYFHGEGTINVMHNFKPPTLQS